MNKSLIAGLPACLSIVVAAWSADWPQLQGNAGHTGYTADQPKPPFTLKWTRRLDEPTHPGAPVIVAEGKVFVGTAWGNLLALDRQTGRTIWSHKTGAPITGTPAYAEGLVYVNSMDRCCHALRASDGAPQFKYETGEGIGVAPVIAGDTVFIASRDGQVYALEARTGALRWKSAAGGMTMAAPAWDAGRLFVPGGDNCIHAFESASGKLLWKSERLPGMALRDYWLVAARGRVLASSQLVLGAHQTYERIEREMMTRFREKSHGQVLDQTSLLAELRAWFEQHPDAQTYHVLEAATGRRRCLPVPHAHGGGCAGALPAVGPDGPAHLIYANVRLRASGWTFVGRADLETCSVEPFFKGRYRVDKNEWEWQGATPKGSDRHSPWAVGFCVNDQSWGVSRGGDLLFAVRDPGWAASEGAFGWVNVNTEEDGHLVGQNRTLSDALWNGCFGGAFHATASPMAISGNQVFHKAVRNVIVCFEGSL